MNFEISSFEQLLNFTKTFASKLTSPSTIALIGDLGAGKTTFVANLLKHYGFPESVTSPTFVLQHEYLLTDKNLIFEHWDLYRLNSIPQELEEPLNKTTIRLIEWADKFPEIINEADYILKFKLELSSNKDNYSRFVELITKSCL